MLGPFATLVMPGVMAPRQKRCPQKWTKMTAQDMADLAYLQKLADGNIGVILGPAVGAIGSFNWDDDQLAEEFLVLNPDLRETLAQHLVLSRGDHVPSSCKLKRDGQARADWRFNDCQNIIGGQHPSSGLYSWGGTPQRRPGNIAAQ